MTWRLRCAWKKWWGRSWFRARFGRAWRRSRSRRKPRTKWPAGRKARRFESRSNQSHAKLTLLCFLGYLWDYRKISYRSAYLRGVPLRTQQLIVRDQLCVSLGTTTGIQSIGQNESVSQLTARIQTMSHQRVQKGWHITGRYITGTSQYIWLKVKVSKWISDSVHNLRIIIS